MVRRVLVVEELEPRTLLASSNSLTVITHGFQGDAQFPLWVYDMARAINERSGNGASELQILNSKVTNTLPIFGVPPGSSRNFLLFDWSAASRLPGTANNDSVAGTLTRLVQNRLPSTGQIDIHFVGHSRGCYVTRAAIAQLTAADNAKINFLQMTTLDPQAFGTDGPLNVPANVDWADNYYQQTAGFREPAGVPISLANVNLDLSQVLDLWPGRSGGFKEHSEVHDWYHWTIDLTDNNSPFLSDKLLLRINSTIRSLLYDSLNVDLDKNGTADLLAGGSRIGFHYSLGDSLGPRAFTGFGGLDLVFVIDLTSSMADDIAAVKSAAVTIVNDVFMRVPSVRIGIVTFKDFPVDPFGDPGDFPSRTALAFSNSSASVVAAINSLSTGGGGNTPNSVHSALVHAIDNQSGLGSWRGGTIRKAILLMGDSPAHEPEPFTGFTITSTTMRAVNADPVDVFGVVIGFNSQAQGAFEKLSQTNGGVLFSAPSATDVTAAILQVIEAITLPTVERITINDGSAQRSKVRSLTLTFSTSVTIDPGAFEVIRRGIGPVGLNVTTSLVGGKTVAVLNFTAGTLADGNYTLTTRGDRIRDSAGRNIDGDGNSRTGGDRTDLFFTFFGDSDGDRDVDNLDFFRFQGTYNKRSGDPGFLWYFDWDGDGDVDAVDLSSFTFRRGSRLEP